MIEFFRDILSGPVYIIVVILSIIFIMAIIGFIMERKNQEKEEKGRIAYVENSTPVPMEPVDVKVEETIVPDTEQVSLNSVVNEEVPKQDNPGLLVETPVVVFDDPDKNS